MLVFVLQSTPSSKCYSSRLVSSYLGNEALEETRQTLVLGHVGQNPEAALGVVKVTVLDTGLDDVERRGDDERGRRAGDGGDEVLEPGGLVVVLEVEEVLLGESRASEELRNGSLSVLILDGCCELLSGWRMGAYGERSGGVASGGPSPASVQAKALVGNNLEDATAAEGLGVRLALDLEHIEGQQDDFTNTNQAVTTKHVSQPQSLNPKQLLSSNILTFRQSSA